MNRKNNCVFEGNLVNDPKLSIFLKTDRDGNERENRVVNFTLACDGGRTGHDNETFFVNLEAWDTAADRIAEFSKGDAIHCECIGRNKEYLSRQTGETKRDIVFRVLHYIPIFVKERLNATV